MDNNERDEIISYTAANASVMRKQLSVLIGISVFNLIAVLLQIALLLLR